MFRATLSPIDGREAGFTIIEVLIALAVVAVSMVAIGSVMSTNVRGVRALEQHVTLMETARAVMAAEVPPRAKLDLGSLSGMVNDHQWRIDIGPMDKEWAAPDADTAWVPALVKVQVRSPSGAVLDLTTVRLMHGASK
ncbi:MAG TPA: prepilin-type N-terminal cleavage/methylation domain-containing protein [Bradyrhizobium sp.]|nr:prepilin-type N-terminal cleavage/methylation domain-containing protein [Bradyrhizobium sp.]